MRIKTCVLVALVAALVAPLPRFHHDNGAIFGALGELSPKMQLTFVLCLRGTLVTALAVLYSSIPMLLALWYYRQIPGPTPLPLLGNLISIRKHSYHKLVERWGKQYGPVFKIFFGSGPVLVISDLELTREIGLRRFSDFMNHSRHSPEVLAVLPDPMRAVGTKSILRSRGNYWKGLRSTAASVFRDSEKLSTFQPLMHATATELADRLADVKEGEFVDILEAFQDMTLDVIGSTVFGIRFNCVRNKSSDVVKAARSTFRNSGVKMLGRNPYMLALLASPSLSPLVTRLAKAFPTQSMKEGAWASNVLGGLSDKLFDEASEEGNRNSATAEAPCGVEYEHIGESFLKLFIKAHNRETGNGLSRDEVTAQALVLLLGGYDTTSITLAVSVYLLSKNKDKEEEMIKEIDRLADTDITSLDDIQEYKYVEAVVKEALRMNGPLGLTDRVATNTVDVKGIGTIYKDTPVHIPFRNMHYDPKYFPNPEDFLPERFLPNTDMYGKQNHKAFMPWGLGPRMCVAYNFSLAEAKLALITLYRRFRFSLNPNFQLRTAMDTTISPVDGIPVLVHKRVANKA
mmetsp:Transcript_6593/g.16799  ORF Transcript_6593/g.16799 Transcript_6593/m.16799 type:complete len:572 (+) Transcript_6593:171-1886(+)